MAWCGRIASCMQRPISALPIHHLAETPFVTSKTSAIGIKYAHSAICLIISVLIMFLLFCNVEITETMLNNILLRFGGLKLYRYVCET